MVVMEEPTSCFLILNHTRMPLGTRWESIASVTRESFLKGAKVKRRNFLKGSLGLTALILGGCGEAFQDVPSGAAGPSTSPPPPSPSAATGLLSREGLLVAGPDGVLYELDFFDHQLRRLDQSGQVVWEVGELPFGDGVFNYPSDLEFDAEGLLYIADRGNAEIDVLDPINGALVRTLGRDHLSSVKDLTFRREDNTIYAVDTLAHRIVVLSTQGQLLRTFGDFGVEEQQLNGPTALAFDSRGDLHVVDSGNARVQVFSATGSWLRSYGRRGSNLGEFVTPIAILMVPDQELVWVADSVAGFITVFDLDGNPLERFVPKLPDGTSLHPKSMALGLDDSVFITGVPQAP